MSLTRSISLFVLLPFYLFSQQTRIPGPGGHAAGGGGGSPTFVNTTTAIGSFSGSSVTLTLAEATSSGNELSVGMTASTGIGCAGYTFTVAATANGSSVGDTFTLITGSPVSQNFQCVFAWAAPNISAASAGQYVITFTQTGGTGLSLAGLGEMQFTHLSAVDNQCTGSNTAGTPVVCSSSMTPSVSPAVITGWTGDYYHLDTVTASSGFTLPSGGHAAAGTDGNPGQINAEYQICLSSCTGTAYTPGFAVTGSQYSVIIGDVLK